MVSFWMKPLNWSTSGVTSQTVVWIGVKSQAIVTLTRYDATTLILYETMREYHCHKRLINIVDNVWNHVQFYWESNEYGRKAGGQRAFRNGHELGGYAWCGWKPKRLDPVHPIGHIVIGAQPAEDTMTNYTNYAQFEMDDLRIRSTFRTVSPGVKGNDWYYSKGSWLHKYQPRYDYSMYSNITRDTKNKSFCWKL